MKVISYSLLTIFLFTAATCNRAIPHANMDKQLIGIWIYTGKSGGYAGKAEKADPSINNTLEFQSGFRYIRKINKKVTEQGKYELYKTKSIYSGKEDNAIRFGSQSSNLDRKSIITIQNNILTIADNVYDGFKTEYIRFNN